MYPLWTQVLGVVACLLLLFGAIYVAGNGVFKLKEAGILPRGPSPVARVTLIAMFPILVLLMHTIRSRLSMYGYITWLKTFDEPVQEQRRDDSARRWLSYLVGSLKRTWQTPRDGSRKQWLMWRSREPDSDEPRDFPGAISI